ncbi:carbohydrate ABC transporter permease [Mycoplasma iguanae]|uniref:Carbohydrate ABC transporter permease n=1 Tax=Mycoplasma iguanae TaxID=292461 RepID=A0ABY5R8A4_9MOLU|nr:carbohydrate ABC transporter permease [Mycoplasma iguanae]UVD81724.1 carbohydrate ABC transporter permease [Mycoplasma iguanae]
MFTIKLKIQKFISNIVISRNADKISAQVRENSFFQIFKAFLWKAIILGFFALLIVLPFYIMIILSISSNEYIREAGQDRSIFWPDGMHFSNFVDAWEKGYFEAIMGSLIVTVLSIVFKIFFAMFFGYAFSLRNWRFKKAMWAVFLSILLLPDSALLLGQYRVVTILGWTKGYYLIGALFLPYVASVVSGFMYRNSFEQIPDRVKEAAMVDGCSGIKYLVKVAMPMVSPTTWTVMILTAFSAWNALLWPLLLLNGNDFMNVINIWAMDIGRPVVGADEVLQIDQGTKMAGSILAILPMFIFFFLFRKRIMGAIGKQGSAIKG